MVCITTITYYITNAKKTITVYSEENPVPFSTGAVLKSGDTSNNLFTIIAILGNKITMNSRIPITGMKIGTKFVQA